MKKIRFILAAFAATAILSAVETPTATPQSSPEFPKQPEIWINGGTPVKSDFNKETVADSFSGTILRKLDKMPETGEFRQLTNSPRRKRATMNFLQR